MWSLRLKILAASSIAVTLTACGVTKLLESDKVEYKSAGKMQPLEIPPDLTRPSSNDNFVVPDINPRGEATFSDYSKDRAGAPAPSRSTVLPSPENTRIERSGNQRWLVVKNEPGAVWNVVRDFWQEAGFIIDTENPDAGVMETDWAERRAKIPDDNFIRNILNKGLRNTRIVTAGAPVGAAERTKFRTRLERGAEPGTTEVYISHRGMEEVVNANSNSDAPTVWKIQPPNPDIEAEMLGKLMARFGVKQDSAKAEVAAGTASAVAPTPARATLLKSQDGTGLLSVNDQFDRAWRRVGLALDRVGFTVEDRDRSKGLYFVRYADPDAGDKAAESKGFFSKLNPFSKSEKKPAAAGTGDQFRIQVKDADSVSQVNVLSKDGAQEKSATATRILALLYEQLK